MDKEFKHHDMFYRWLIVSTCFFGIWLIITNMSNWIIASIITLIISIYIDYLIIKTTNENGSDKHGKP